MLVSEAKVRIVFQSMNKVADFVKSGFTYGGFYQFHFLFLA